MPHRKSGVRESLVGSQDLRICWAVTRPHPTVSAETSEEPGLPPPPSSGKVCPPILPLIRAVSMETQWETYLEFFLLQSKIIHATNNQEDLELSAKTEMTEKLEFSAKKSKGTFIKYFNNYEPL